MSASVLVPGFMCFCCTFEVIVPVLFLSCYTIHDCTDVFVFGFCFGVSVSASPSVAAVYYFLAAILILLVAVDTFFALPLLVSF